MIPMEFDLYRKKMTNVKKKIFKVSLKEEGDVTLPEGSIIYVHTVTKHFYKGIWSSYLGSIEVKILKNKCKRIRALSKRRR
jgi:hypothetical protein